MQPSIWSNKKGYHVKAYENSRRRGQLIQRETDVPCLF